MEGGGSIIKKLDIKFALNLALHGKLSTHMESHLKLQCVDAVKYAVSTIII